MFNIITHNIRIPLTLRHCVTLRVVFARSGGVIIVLMNSSVIYDCIILYFNHIYAQRKRIFITKLRKLNNGVMKVCSDNFRLSDECSL